MMREWYMAQTGATSSARKVKAREGENTWKSYLNALKPAAVFLLVAFCDVYARRTIKFNTKKGRNRGARGGGATTRRKRVVRRVRKWQNCHLDAFAKSQRRRNDARQTGLTLVVSLLFVVEIVAALHCFVLAAALNRGYFAFRFLKTVRLCTTDPTVNVHNGSATIHPLRSSVAWWNTHVGLMVGTRALPARPPPHPQWL